MHEHVRNAISAARAALSYSGINKKCQGSQVLTQLKPLVSETFAWMAMNRTKDLVSLRGGYLTRLYQEGLARTWKDSRRIPESSCGAILLRDGWDGPAYLIYNEV
jgi:hypothetical protein